MPTYAQTCMHARAHVCMPGKLYSGMVDCFVKSAKAEGVMSLYNGFLPNFGRVVPRVMIVFLVMEQLKEKFG